MTPKEERIAYMDNQKPHTVQEQLAIEIFLKEVKDDFSEKDILDWAESKRKELNASVEKELKKINDNLKEGEEPCRMKDLSRGAYKTSYDKLYVMEMIANMW